MGLRTAVVRLDQRLRLAAQQCRQAGLARPRHPHGNRARPGCRSLGRQGRHPQRFRICAGGQRRAGLYQPHGADPGGAKTLDIQYYAIFADDTTQRMFEALREAANRGVRIRILLDDFNTSGKNAQVLKLAFEKNIELRLFNPLPGGRSSLFFRILSNLKDVDRIQRRMHNKIFITDNAVAITGGRNLGETYFGQSENTNFVDIDILAAGRMARDLSRSFDRYWNNPQAYPVQSLMTAKEIEALKPQAGNAVASPGALPSNPDKTTVASGTPTAAAGSVNPTTTERVVTSPGGATTTLPALPESTNLSQLTWTWAPSVMLVDKPSKIAADADSTEESQDTAVDGLLQLMSQAKTDLLIVTSYFVPGPRMMEQLAAIRQKASASAC
ncbi:phospholipase D-like domain-containing protein [Polaromonas sp. P1(28)-8]|nr:phospholipase D-like domain-containing protein [Polaromonas sp. P1(28)-8]